MTDMARLNTMLHTAEHRMQLHGEITGLACDKVMVFPQGQFSVEAMQVLKFRNFHAAVNTTPHPMGQPARLTIGELAEPLSFDMPASRCFFASRYSKPTGTT